MEETEKVMSKSKNISLWKKKSKIDYTPIFVALWLSFNAWLKKEYQNITTDRQYINLLKRSSSPLSDRFAELINPNNINESPLKFRGDFTGLIKSLDNANIHYHKNEEETISFKNCVVEWNTNLKEGEKQIYMSIIKKETDPSKIKIGENSWIDDNVELVFAAYIENLYQIRCAFFHGALPPIEENERVIKHLYLTLSMLMEKAK